MKKILVVAFILLLTACSYDPYEMPKDAYIKTNDITYEVYDTKAKIKDLINDTNTKIINKKEILNTTKIGENKTTIIYKYKNKRREYKYDVNYSVKDTTAPVFLNAASNITLYKDSEYNFCEKISYADNYDKEVNCVVEGNIDLNTVGTYNLKYVLTDSSENKAEKDLVVSVINKTNYYGGGSGGGNTYTPNYLYFSDVIKNYKTNNTMIGIDVSRFQEEIDFEKVKNAGCEFVIMRLGINSDIDKDISVDKYYYDNIRKAKEAGLKVGIYVYTTAIDKDKAIEHAKWTKDILKKEKLDFPVAFDWENWSSFSKYKISTYDLTKTYMAFSEEMKKDGYDTMLYSSMNYLYKVWMFNDSYKVWLAHYTDKTSYDGKYIMWQMSDQGKIDGIKGNVDIDIYYKE